MASERLYAVIDTIAAGTSASAAYINMVNYKPLSIILPDNWTLCDIIFKGSPDLIRAGFLASTSTGLRYRLSNAAPGYQFILPASIFVTTRYLALNCLAVGTNVLINQVNTVELTYYCRLNPDVPAFQAP